jgi:hypothetical protein
MDERRPFDLVPVGDGCYELRAFSDDSEDPIRIVLDQVAGRELAVALGEALVSLDDPRAVERQFHVTVGPRQITLVAVPGLGLRLAVTRESR